MEAFYSFYCRNLSTFWRLGVAIAIFLLLSSSSCHSVFLGMILLCQLDRTTTLFDYCVRKFQEVHDQSRDTCVISHVISAWYPRDRPADFACLITKWERKVNQRMTHSVPTSRPEKVEKRIKIFLEIIFPLTHAFPIPFHHIAFMFAGTEHK